MTLPARSEVKEDVLFLERAIRALDDAKQSLKQFRGAGSVEKDRVLAESVKELRQRVKNVRKLARAIARSWIDSSTY